MGHTPASPGASRYLDELAEDRRIGAALEAELKKRGHAVVGTTPPVWVAYPDEINQRVRAANSSGADLFVSVHLNAGGGTGTEVLYFSGDNAGLAYAQRISGLVARLLSIKNRGAKPRTSEVGVIRDTVMTAVLVEVCFVDSPIDRDAYAGSSPEAIARAIADGIEGEATKPVVPAPEGLRYRASTDPAGKRWMSEMRDLTCSCDCGDDFAGDGSSPILWLAIDAPTGYQVMTSNGWLEPVRKYDVHDLVNGTAGDGTPIRAVRVLDDGIEYAVKNRGEGFLPNMVGTADTGGSADDFAGNGGIIVAFKARRLA